ncbi:tyrosine--tRNA ligase [Sulfolobus sp. A20-N-F6]|nr:tyrosine--tRNA ligase [Sulfolobus sp. A20]TRM78648.1 tyrosine--tRNA ligase [Sulfolobus sp. B5]TRM81131.1 tyrosine--tRNA ligase [Sulfolobus sp. D5]TRM82725.1 tyrosine--tRNA ligase [Sulfolobus sp. A20-N-F6]TRM87147.1 tyrosine--tRNA ligase [Sulfolobus sp. E3]TRM88627.1 tyrosine--tRNA ligase [Sulfolobus sp. C3]TRN01465.1 tyrosine--tRNA ligase [Sulfolobus sp. E1]TRN02978.1 tyrosine--tRNA ligase [Sulfolobus sp. F1]
MMSNHRLQLITRNVAEVITIDELKDKLDSNQQLKGYIGFEPSGLFHIGWLIWAQKLKDLIDAGVEMSILRATWHAWINDKLGGDMNLIKLAADYTIEVLRNFGIDTTKLKVIDAEELVEDKNYWSLVLKVAKSASLARIKRALTIMGRKAEEAEIDASKLIYPAMQVSDIFYLDLDLALGGTDQRKAHMLARDVAEKLGKKKVISIHTPLLVGLQGGQRMNTIEGLEEDDIQAEIKMSKSKPESAVFVNDPPEDVERKIMGAYCPKGVVENNPIIQIIKYIIFTKYNSFKIERDIKYGGDIEFKSYEELEKMYIDGKIHPMDLKKATAKKLNEILDPIRRGLDKKSEYKDLIQIISKSVSR